MGQTHAKRNGAGRKANGAGRKTNGASHKANGKAQSPEATAYDAFKQFEGQRYTGMRVGRGHKWEYQAGEWTEKKVTPDKWEFRYSVPKRRRGRAPEGSGVPVGTAYHWYILAHQTVTKLDANNYTTDMVGLKYKLAHRRADKTSWSASDRAQRKRLIQILQEMISDLETQVAEASAGAKSIKKSSKPRKPSPLAAA